METVKICKILGPKKVESRQSINSAVHHFKKIALTVLQKFSLKKILSTMKLKFSEPKYCFFNFYGLGNSNFFVFYKIN